MHGVPLTAITNDCSFDMKLHGFGNNAIKDNVRTNLVEKRGWVVAIVSYLAADLFANTFTDGILGNLIPWRVSSP